MPKCGGVLEEPDAVVRAPLTGFGASHSPISMTVVQCGPRYAGKRGERPA